MSLMGNMIQSKEFNLLQNVGCLLDIPTGTYVKGASDEMILNGGVGNTTGVTGRAKTFKSTLAWHCELTIMDHCYSAEMNKHDTEQSTSNLRAMNLAHNMPHIGGHNLMKEGRLTLTKSDTTPGNVWFDNVKDIAEAKSKNPKMYKKLTPFVDADGNQIAEWYPTVFGLDSVSQFEVASTLKMMAENSVGDKDLNTMAMRAAMAKNQMIRQVPDLCTAHGLFMFLTAHIGDTIEMDPHSPTPKKLGFMQGKSKIKDVSEKFSFLMYNCWSAHNMPRKLLTKDGTPQWPRGPEDDIKGDTDLLLLSFMNLRGNSGPSGLPIEFIASQKEGMLPGMSQFHYLRTFDGFGIAGNDRNYYLDLCPDVKLQRTNVRTKLEESPWLRRAMEVTADMCQMSKLWVQKDKELLMTPEDLWTKLKERGYDMEEIFLGTRNYWQFDEDAEQNPLKFASTLDLLRMAHGLYKPAWYAGAVK